MQTSAKNLLRLRHHRPCVTPAAACCPATTQTTPVAAQCGPAAHDDARALLDRAADVEGRGHVGGGGAGLAGVELDLGCASAPTAASRFVAAAWPPRKGFRQARAGASGLVTAQNEPMMLESWPVAGPRACVARCAASVPRPMPAELLSKDRSAARAVERVSRLPIWLRTSRRQEAASMVATPTTTWRGATPPRARLGPQDRARAATGAPADLQDRQGLHARASATGQTASGSIRNLGGHAAPCIATSAAHRPRDARLARRRLGDVDVDLAPSPAGDLHWSPRRSSVSPTCRCFGPTS